MRRLLGIAFAALVTGLIGAVPAHGDDAVLCRISDERLTEISGLAYSQVHDDVVWTHNDSGGGAYLYALDTRTCDVVARITLEGVPARDIEAIAAGVNARGERVLWVGDIGDNTADRRTVSIYEVREPADLVSQTVRPVRYALRYSRAQDAEALIADPSKDQLWIISKGILGGSVWEVSRPLWPGSLARVTKVGEEGGFVTDAAMAPDGSRYAVRDYGNVRIYRGHPPGDLITQQPLPDQVQGEAVTWMPDGRALLVASEADNRLIRVALPEEAWMRSAQGQDEPTTSNAEAAPAPGVKVSPAVGPVDRLGSLAVVALLAGGLVLAMATAAVFVAVVISRQRARG